MIIFTKNGVPISRGGDDLFDVSGTDKTALPGTRRHDRYDGRANPFTSQYAGELGWVIWLAMVARA